MDFGNHCVNFGKKPCGVDKRGRPGSYQGVHLLSHGVDAVRIGLGHHGGETTVFEDFVPDKTHKQIRLHRGLAALLAGHAVNQGNKASVRSHKVCHLACGEGGGNVFVSHGGLCGRFFAGAQNDRGCVLNDRSCIHNYRGRNSCSVRRRFFAIAQNDRVGIRKDGRRDSNGLFRLCFNYGNGDGVEVQAAVNEAPFCQDVGRFFQLRQP